MASRVISSLFGAAFVVSASGIAFAADMPIKAPLTAPAAVYNWTGWYVGVNAGASQGIAKTDFNNAPVDLVFAPGGVLTQTANSPNFGFSDTTSPDGFIGGGQIGYNWQYSPLIVVGLEADFQGSAERDSKYLTTSASIPFSVVTLGTPSVVSAPVTDVTNYTTKIEWFGTVRGRIGYVWGNGNVLSYVTGG
jgi:outer membrane immunogenic protein